MKKYNVYLGSCPEYNPDTVAGLIETAIPKLNLKKSISGRIVIKPNLVMAHPKVATEGYTRAEVVEGLIRFLKKDGMTPGSIRIVEKSGLGVTTAAAFRYAGYKKLARKFGIKLIAMEESRQRRVELKSGRIHNILHIAAELADRDFLIFMPKLKTNVLAHGFTGALKLNIGTVDSRERMYKHNIDLPVKIVDILEAANPDLIITDGIRFSFGGNQMTQGAIPLGVLAIADNAVAHDMICSELIGLDPFGIEHIREAVDRGYGPASMAEIQVHGEIDPEAIKNQVKDLDFGFYPVQQFPEKHPCRLKIISGEPYCTGGCQGIFLDWLHMIKDRKPHLLKRFPDMTVLVSKTDEAVSARRILLVGDCAIQSPHVKARRKIRIRGCPPTHKRIVWDMMVNLALLAPLVRPSLIWDGFVAYPLKKVKGFIIRLFCRP